MLIPQDHLDAILRHRRKAEAAARGNRRVMAAIRVLATEQVEPEIARRLLSAERRDQTERRD